MDVAGNIVNSNAANGWIGLTGDLPGYSNGAFGTLRSSATYIYFSGGGKYSGYLGGTADAIFGLNNSATDVKVQLNTNGNSYLTGGNVGIGTPAPSTKLQVYGGAFQQVNSDLNSGIYLDATATSEPKVGWRVSDNSERFRIHFKGVNTASERLAFFKTIGSEAEVFSVFANGNVGIGTTTVPERLNVNGKIKCEEVQVVVDVPADYVFESEYKLPPLSELDGYIQQNKHLPGVPNAQTLKTNGWNVGEMNNKLLEKIEELTLYMIELKKENEKLKQRMNNIERTK